MRVQAASWRATGRSWPSSMPMRAWSRSSRSTLAAIHLMRLAAGHRRLPRRARSASALRTNALNALGATAALLVAAVAVFWSWRRFDTSAHEPASGTDPNGRDPVVRSDARGTNLEGASRRAHRASHARAADDRSCLQRVRARAVSPDPRAVARHARVRRSDRWR